MWNYLYLEGINLYWNNFVSKQPVTAYGPDKNLPLN